MTKEFAWTPSSNADVPAYSGPNEDDIISLNESEDDPLQKSMERFIQEEDDTISDDNSNICKGRKTGKETAESAQKVSTNMKFKILSLNWWRLLRKEVLAQKLVAL
ncbi:hypothetical protein POM88_019567 [Heracleum sosnowskyi]|uniref:Uncharacterized protein n=1 Tax=Heracleum sosnowskyi TaxID=360622 RepID=A0AAD8I9S9_9APIA|nr:hypothetical protein POM88_019567 [Heracleum sosnowskyi]